MKNRILVLVATLAALVGTPAHAQFNEIQRQELRDRNLLGRYNAGFENGSTLWTGAGSGTIALTSTAANVAYGTKAVSFDALTGSDTLTSKQVTIPAGLYGASCVAEVSYKGGDANLALRVIDGSLNVLTSRTMETQASWQRYRLAFQCPTSGTMAVQIRATGNAAIAYLDQVFLGADTRDVDVSPVVYSVSKSAVGSVGSASQIVAGHTLAAEDFPVTTGKIAYWNLASSATTDNSGALMCTAGTAACTLTTVGTAPAAATGVDGTTSAYSISAGYWKSTDAKFAPGNGKSWAFGGWFKAADWTPASTQVLASNMASASDRGFEFYVTTSGDIIASGTNTPAGIDASITIPNPGFVDGTWHHVALVYDFTDSQLRAYYDGRRQRAVFLANTRSVTAPFFAIGSETGSFQFIGSVDEPFFASDARLTDDDIRKLYAYKLAHNKGIAVADQRWVGSYARSDNKIEQQMMDDWIVAQDTNNVYWDLSGLASTSQFSARLLQYGFNSMVVPNASYDSGELTAAPTVPFSHNLPGRPQWVRVEQKGQIESTSWSDLDGVCWAKGDTQVNCDFSTLTINSTNPIRITANMTPGASAVRPATSTASGLVSREIAPSEGDLGTLTWTAGTAPSGTVSKRYKWSQVGKVVTLQWRIEATVAGATVNYVSFSLPSDVPSPANASSQSADEWTVTGEGAVLAAGNSQLTLGGSSGIYKTGSGTYLVFTYAGSSTVAATFVIGSITYVVD